MKQIYPPRENTIEYPQYKIFIPYTVLEPATLISLIGYNYTPVETPKDDPFAYCEYFKKRWEEKEKFISIEQDTVVWPGAIEAIWDCPEELCAYDAHLPNQRKRALGLSSGGIPLACIKISKEFILKTPNLWDKTVDWRVLDIHLLTAGIAPHQHYPSVVNANPALLGFVKEAE